MKTSRRRVLSLVSLLMFANVVGLISGRKASGESSIDSEKYDASKIVEGFAEALGGRVTNDETNKSRPVFNEGREFHSVTTGRMIEVGSTHYLAFVSMSTGTVTYFLNRSGFPESIPVFGNDGTPVSPAEVKNRAVKLPLEKARESAVEVVQTVLGEIHLSRLCQSRGRLYSRGSFYVYEFSWTECTDKHGNAEFLSRVSVEINPESGELISYSNQTSVPDTSLDSAVAQRLDGASTAQLKKDNVSIVSRVPFKYWHSGGSAEDACVVRYRIEDGSQVAYSSLTFSLRDFRLMTQKADATTAGIWDASAVCP